MEAIKIVKYLPIHTLSGVLCLCAVLFFMQNGKCPWVYKSFLLWYIVSRAATLTIFLKHSGVLKGCILKYYFSAAGDNDFFIAISPVTNN
jgi:hypothetical protein